MATLTYKVDDTLHLVRQFIGKEAPAKPAPAKKTNHILVLDVSGSMSYDLPQIRDQLKAKLPKLLGPDDTVSIIWFSGRGQFGVLLEAEAVASLTDLQQVNQAIDRWLRPVGLTGFKEPLEEVSRLVERVSKKRADSVFSLFFMSDGCDNQWPRPEILKTVEAAAGKLAAATFVEYGYYADRPLLTQMAERAGGTLIFSDSFPKYQPIFEAAMSKRPVGSAKKVAVRVDYEPVGGFAWVAADGDLTTYGLDDTEIQVPESTAEVWYLTRDTVKQADWEVTETQHAIMMDLWRAGLYAGISLFSVRMKPEVVLPLLKATGDVRFIESFASCFGKQRYSTFMDEAKAAVFDPARRLEKGYDPSKVPADDAFTVIELLELLASDDRNRVLLDHPDFKYSRISRARMDANVALTPEEQTEVANIMEEMKKTRDSRKLKAFQEKINAITDAKKALEFKADPAPDGYEIGSLVFNEDRPNIGFNVRQTGVVHLGDKIPANRIVVDGDKTIDLSKVPVDFRTFRFRTYAVVRDGLVNVEKLPVRVTEAVANELAKRLPEEARPEHVYRAGDLWDGVITVSALPVVNRQMVKAVSARALFERQWSLEKARAAQKVYKAYKDAHIPKKESASFKLLYGDPAAEWLKEAGFTDYSGFNPKSVQAESTDFYVGKALEVKLKGLSSMPKVSEVKTRIDEIRADTKGKKKHTTATALMAPFVEECELLETEKPKDLVKVYDTKADVAVTRARQLIFELARIKFAIVVGQVWFTEFASLDENSLELELDGQKIPCKAEMKEVEIRI